MRERNKTIYLILDHDQEVRCATECKGDAEVMIIEADEEGAWTIEETQLHYFV